MTFPVIQITHSQWPLEVMHVSTSKAHIPLEMGFTLATQCEWNLHTKNEMYMANARNLHLGPNTTYILLTRVGGFALGDAKNLRHATQKIPTCWYICIMWRNSTQREWFCVAVEYRLYVITWCFSFWFDNPDQTQLFVLGTTIFCFIKFQSKSGRFIETLYLWDDKAGSG